MSTESLRAALAELVAAWESLPGGKTYGKNTIQRWLVEDIKPAIDAARAALAQRANESVALTDELLDKIERALERHVYGHAARRIPADPTDSDIVLYELRTARAAAAAYVPLSDEQIEAIFKSVDSEDKGRSIVRDFARAVEALVVARMNKKLT